MKKMLFVLIALVALFVPMKGQESIVDDTPFSREERVMPKDSLPNLWIVTIDMSGSMKDKETTKDKPIYQLIQRKVESILNANGAVPTDSILFLKSGIDKTLLLSSIKGNETLLYFSTRRSDGTYPRYHHKEICFPTSFVRQLKGGGSMALPKGKTFLNSLCADGTGFDASLSFTSLIRPLSIYILTKNGVSFNEYDSIFHVLVTDDGDVNDQWNQDYKYLKKFTKPHFDTVCDILPKVACSNFDFASKQTAKFEEVCPPYDSTQPRIYLTQYITYQEKHPEKKLMVESLVTVSDFHDNRLTLKMKPCGDSIAFVYVENCYVNGHLIPVNRYLYLKDSISVVYDTVCTNTFRNKVSVEGTYQEIYNDRILGWRYRKVSFDGELFGLFVPEETKTVERKIALTITLLLLVIIGFILIWRECAVLRIFVDGKCMRISRKAMNKLKHGKFEVLKVVCDKKDVMDTIWYKGRGVKLCNDDEGNTEPRGTKLFIKSFRGLSIDCSSFIWKSDKLHKNTTIEFDYRNEGDIIQFQYSDKLSHNLIISFEASKSLACQNRENLLNELNINMLARYYEQNIDRIDSVCNNVEVNIIRKETLDDSYDDDYAILNIYDLNSDNSASHIFLRYSLMCFFDRNRKSDVEAKDILLEVASCVLKSEHQKKGFVENTPFTENQYLESSIKVDVSPMLSYFYLHKKGKTRLVYSPFADGYIGLDKKAVNVFPNSAMLLLNLPFKYKHPETKIGGPTKVDLEKSYCKTETMVFLGGDVVRFLNVEKDWSSGIPDNYEGGITFHSWELDTILQEIKQ